MGMAASQARFLGLTARKTNVEYQGQQVNQARTALANESAGLFNAMMTLKVPLPPVVNNYYESHYTFQGSALDAKYTISSMTEIAGRDKPTYSVVVDYMRGILSGFTNGLADNDKITIAKEMVDIKDDTGTVIGQEAKYYYTNNGVKTEVVAVKDDQGDLKAIEALRANANLKIPDEQEFYKYASGSPPRTNYVFAPPNTVDDEYKSSIFYAQNINKPFTATAEAVFEKDPKTGRYTSAVFSSVVVPEGHESVKADLEGFHELGISKDYNEAGYNEAMINYGHEKMVYDNEIQKINAKTEAIQQQDRTLELKLRQLDTEQKALQTEMESVQKVIQKNIEVTFKTFA